MAATRPDMPDVRTCDIACLISMGMPLELHVCATLPLNIETCCFEILAVTLCVTPIRIRVNVCVCVCVGESE